MTDPQAGPGPLADAHQAALAERYGPPVREYRPPAISPERAALNAAVLDAATEDMPVDDDSGAVDIPRSSTEPSTDEVAKGQPDPHDDDEEVA